MANRQRTYKKYGIKATEYENMFRCQEGKCAICEETTPGQNLHIDHNHETGEVRGLLCSQCNMFIGLAKEDKNILSRAIKYLEEEGHPSRFYIEAGRLISSR